VTETAPLWLRIGGARIRVVAPAPSLEELGDWCRAYVTSEGPVDIGLHVQLDDSLPLGPEEVDEPTPFQVSQADGVFAFSRPGTAGTLRHLPGGGLFVDVRGLPGRFAPSSALRVALSLWLPPRRGLLLHGSAVTHAGRALVFLGRSGRGKTTISRLLVEGGASPLEDELLVVRRTPSGWLAESTPFGFRNPRDRRASAPVSASFLLSHGSENRVAELPLAARTLELCGSVVWFGRSAAATEAVLESAADFAHDTALKGLAFLPTHQVRDVLISPVRSSL
jgi:hypothetical protein